MSERKRCPNGSRKDKKTGECVQKGERGPFKKIKVLKKNVGLINIMSSETRSNYENALNSLKRSQVVELFKKIKNVLELNVGKKSKSQLVKEILELHGSGSRPNMYGGKQLLSFEKDSHIKIPRRETRQEGRQAKVEKEVKKVGAKKALVDKRVKSTEKKIEDLTKSQKDLKQKNLIASKKEKVAGSKAREKQRRLSDILEQIASVKRRSKGASRNTMRELGNELKMLKKKLAEVKK